MGVVPSIYDSTAMHTAVASLLYDFCAPELTGNADLFPDAYILAWDNPANMHPSNQASGLLTGNNIPSRRDYENFVRSLAEEPFLLEQFFLETKSGEIELAISTKSSRFGFFFRQINDWPPSTAQLESKQALAKICVTHILKLLPYIGDNLKEEDAIDVLIPVMRLAKSMQTPNLIQLATKLSRHDFVLRGLGQSEEGGKMIQEWLYDANLIKDDVSALEKWTTYLSDKITKCSLNNRHNVGDVLDRWTQVKTLMQKLQEIEQNAKAFQEARTLHLVERAKAHEANAKLLDKESKKSGSSQVHSQQPDFSLGDQSIQDFLGSFHLPQLTSLSRVQECQQQMSGPETACILKDLARTFPCKTCCQSPHTKEVQSEQRDSSDASMRNALCPKRIGVDILGEHVGKWKIVFSAVFKENLGRVHDEAQRKAILEVLRNLSTKTSTRRRAGSKDQRSRMQVPLIQNFCSQDLSVLWEVDAQSLGISASFQRQIKIWDIGNGAQLANTIDSVISLQSMYSMAHIEKIQTTFRGVEGKSGELVRREKVLDIRTLDEHALELASKFFVLTKPVLRAMEDYDLIAEYPLSLLGEQIDMIEDFQTSTLCLGRSGTGKTTSLIYKLVIRYLQSLASGGEPVCQILLTASSLLAERIRLHTKDLIRTLTNAAPKGEDSTTASHNVLPQHRDLDVVQSVFELDAESFPLICSFDEFLLMLEKTQSVLDQGRESTQIFTTDTRILEDGLVDPHSFRLDYWPHFPLDKTKKLSAPLIFSEIMGIIKGSASLTLAPLTRDEYIRRSTRLAPNFTTDQARSRVYDIFEHYETYKSKRQERDNVDRALGLLKAIRTTPGLKKAFNDRFEEIYVDEIQDQRTVDVTLFLEVVNNIRGFHFAGDTAQNISQESSFRFQDIQAVMYENFRRSAKNLNEAKVKMLQLKKNHRSHQGILNLAAVALKLMALGWPDLVDRLAPEIGDFLGPIPTLFLNCGVNTILSTNIGSSGLSEQRADFGADQVLLVRDGNMKSKMQQITGGSILILTIRQSKGMEFDDVILWDFWSQCPNSSAIRTIEHLYDREKALAYSTANLDMCAELKAFYVAITRSRSHFYMVESSSRTLEPIIKLFEKNDEGICLDITKPGASNFLQKLKQLRPGKSADPQSWSQRAEQFMQQHIYEDALLCFEKASNENGQKRALVKIVEEKARLSSQDPRVSSPLFEQARGLYEELGMISDVSRMLVMDKRFYDAGELWETHGKKDKAAEFYFKAESYLKAATMHEALGQIEKAIHLLKTGSLFDETVHLLARSETHFTLVDKRRHQRLCKLLLKQKKLCTESTKVAIKFVGTEDEQESFFKEYGMHAELVESYERRQKFQSLFDLFLELGQLDKAKDILIHHPLNIAASLRRQLATHVFAKRLCDSLHGRPVSPPNQAINNESELPTMISNHLDTNLLDFYHRVTFPDPLKSLVCAAIIFYGDIVSSCSGLDDTLFKFLEDAALFVKELMIEKTHTARRTLCAILGIWQNYESELSEPRRLDWSPITFVGGSGKEDLLEKAHQMFLNKYGEMLLKLMGTRGKFQELWDVRWPTRCINFLTRGRCRDHETQTCRWDHRAVGEMDFVRCLQDLARIAECVCSLTWLYYRRIMPEDFQKQFLSSRRRYLELLIPKLTYTSAYEQDAETIQKFFSSETTAPSILSSMGDLLLRQLRIEWKERNTYSMILAQSQLAESLGSQIERSLFELVERKLHYVQSSAVNIQLPRFLKEAAKDGNRIAFLFNCARFFKITAGLQPLELTSFQSIVGVYEIIAALLTLIGANQGCVIPRSWIQVAFSSGVRREMLDTPLSWAERPEYYKCIRSLLESFCSALNTLDSTWPAQKLVRNRLVLSQRCAELLALVAVNQFDFNDNVDDDFKSVFSSSQLRPMVSKALSGHHAGSPAFHLGSGNLPNFQEPLLLSFQRYGGRDALRLVLKPTASSEKFSKFRGKIETVKFEELLPSLDVSPTEATTPEANSGHPEDNEIDQTLLVIKAQKICKAWLRRTRARQHHLKTAQGQLIQKYIDLGLRCAARTLIRGLLVLHGPEIDRDLKKVGERLHNARSSVEFLLGSADIARDDIQDLLGNAFDEISLLTQQIERARSSMSIVTVERVVNEGNAQQLETFLTDIRSTLNHAAIALEDIESTVETLSLVDTQPGEGIVRLLVS